jgi:hypothetical protein
MKNPRHATPSPTKGRIPSVWRDTQWDSIAEKHCLVKTYRSFIYNELGRGYAATATQKFVGEIERSDSDLDLLASSRYIGRYYTKCDEVRWFGAVKQTSRKPNNSACIKTKKVPIRCQYC